MLHSVGAGWEAFRRDRGSNVVFYLVEDDVVFESICADDVVVVGILVAPYDSGGLVY